MTSSEKAVFPEEGLLQKHLYRTLTPPSAKVQVNNDDNPVWYSLIVR